MSSNIRYPNITGTTEAAQLLQVRSYLHQLVDQLNMTLKNVESNAAVVTAVKSAPSGKADKENDAQNTFNSIKALIIKSADIVNAYYEEINHRLEGVYVAESEFGAYAEQTTLDITANSKSIESLYSDVQQILSDVEGIDSQIIETNAHINSGLLYYAADGTPVYGLEIGQRNEVDGVVVFNKYARFTADRLSFYDQNDNEVAFISDRVLHITRVEVDGSYIQGGFEDKTLSDGGVVTKWVGTGG